jgi:hypothetical protein
MPPKASKKAGGKKKSKLPPVDPAEVVAAFQKQYAKTAKERGVDVLKLGPSEENAV